MKKFLKYGFYGLIVLITLVLLTMSIIAVTFNPNDYKHKIIDLVKEKKDRTLKLDGDIKLTFWPKIGADLGKISLSEHKNSQEFASVNSVKVSLALLPLLKKELIVDTIYIDGAQTNIIKYKDGSTNFDDLISKDEESQDIKFDIDGVNVANSAISYIDEGTNKKYTITKFNLKSGHITLAEPVDIKADFAIASNQPEMSAIGKLKGIFLVDTKSKHYVAKSLDANLKGDIFGAKNVELSITGNLDAKPELQAFIVDNLKLVGSGLFNEKKLSIGLNAPMLNVQKNEITSKKTTVSLIQEKAGDTFKVNLELENIKGSPKEFESSGIKGDITALQGKRTLTGKFYSPFSGNLESLIYDLPNLAGNLDIKDPSLPSGGMKGSFILAAHTDIKNELFNSKFTINVDDAKLGGNVSVINFKKPSIKFNLNVDKLNLNKLLVKSNTETEQSGKPADLSALKNLLLDGKLNVGSIQYDKFQISGLSTAIIADGEKLTVRGLNVKVDDSQIKGNFGISQFNKPLYSFDLDIDQLDVDKYLSTNVEKTKTDSSGKQLNLSSLKSLNADGSLRISLLKYGKTKATNIRIDLKADGQKLNLNPLVAKIDESQVNASVGISRFSDPFYSVNLNIDKLDADKYITKSTSTSKSSTEETIDLSILKKLNASGEAKIGWLKLANVKTENVNLVLKSEGGIATISPFSANLYQGTMSGFLKVDAREIPSIYFKQSMKSVSIGPLMIDAINNDMLEGKGTVNIDITTLGNNVAALKKSLAGNASLSLTDGALKGIDIAGSVRELKNKVNILKAKDSSSNDKKKTDFSELAASFTIKNGVAHNEDLTMKAPILRLAKGDSRGDIDIGNQTINYLAKPTFVKSLKGQEGADLDALSGFTIPMKITGTFSNPKYGMDFSEISATLAKSKLLEKIGGDKGIAVNELVGGGNKVEALKSLLGKKKPTDLGTTPTSPDATAVPVETPKSSEDQAKEKLKKLFKF